MIDTHCGKRGGDFEIHRRYALNCLNNLRGVINGASAEFKGRVFLDVLQDEHVTPQKIRNYYRKKIGYNPRNHLLFYYGGHGSVDKKHGHYFAMSGGNILRREVFNLMADTGAPGIYILTDCCSSYGTYDPKWLAPVVNAEVRPETLVLAQADVRLLNAVAARSPIASLAPDIVRAGFLGQTVVNRRANVNMFYDLFFRPQGVHSITAASEGTYGWGDNFTVALAEYLTASSSSVRPDGKTGTVTWDNFFFKVRQPHQHAVSCCPLEHRGRQPAEKERCPGSARVPARQLADQHAPAVAGQQPNRPQASRSHQVLRTRLHQQHLGLE